MIRVGCTALTKRIVAGKPTKDGLSLQGGGEDVTSDVLKAVIDFIGANRKHVITADGKPVFEISIRALR